MMLLLTGWLMLGTAVHSQAPLGVGRAQVARSEQEARHHYRLGQDAFRSEHYEEAEAEFRKSIELDPTFELPRYSLGQVFMATHRFRLAIDAYKTCRDVIHANNVADLSNQAARDQRLDDTIKNLEDQRRVYQSAGHLGNPAAVQAFLSQIDSQLSALREERHRDLGAEEPTPAWLSLALGSAYFRVDDTASAEQEYRNAIKVDPKFGEAHSNLAVVLFTTGRVAEADAEIKAAEKAGFKVNPQLKKDVQTALSKGRQ